MGGKEEEPALIVASGMDTNTPYPSPTDSPASKNIIHQTFSLARDWSKHVTWANIPQLKLGNIRGYYSTNCNTIQIWS